MIGINYLAAFGTIFIFTGIYCFKAAFHKQTFKEKMTKANYGPVKNYNKGFFILSGTVCFLLGAILILKALNKII
ncbi:MAG: hypothetical protein ABUT20_62070 [Bacteroidota bacterium]